MNSTNLLLGSTGFLLLVALLFSFTQMNQGKSENPGEIASLKREIERLEDERRQLQNKPTTSLIFPRAPYTTVSSPPVAEEDDAMEQIQDRLDQLAQENSDLRDNLASASRPAPEPLLPDLTEEEEVIEEPAEADPYAERRARLISNALLQATVQAWDPEFWTIAIDPAARANFNVNDELAVRRNDGILCTFTVTSQRDGFYIGDLKSNLAAGAPEIVPGDELIIPPAFDRQLD
ncbi:MAG: hypothetical protein ACSHYB_16520 [Roseibacillus sp.]